MLADALTVSPAAVASRARALARAHALLAESNQPLTMSSDQLYRLLARYQRSLLDLVTQLEEAPPPDAAGSGLQSPAADRRDPLLCRLEP